MQYLNIAKLKDRSNKLAERHNELNGWLDDDKYTDAEKAELQVTMNRIFAKQDTINDIINCFEEK